MNMMLLLLLIWIAPVLLIAPLALIHIARHGRKTSKVAETEPPTPQAAVMVGEFPETSVSGDRASAA